jgi:hypothetical protein
MDGDALPELATFVHNGHESQNINTQSDSTSIICNLCQHIFGCWKKSGISGRTEYSIETKTPLVEMAAKNGCHLCILLLGAFRKPPNYTSRPNAMASIPVISTSIWLDGFDG